MAVGKLGWVLGRSIEHKVRNKKGKIIIKIEEIKKIIIKNITLNNNAKQSKEMKTWIIFSLYQRTMGGKEKMGHIGQLPLKK